MRIELLMTRSQSVIITDQSGHNTLGKYYYKHLNCGTLLPAGIPFKKAGRFWKELVLRGTKILLCGRGWKFVSLLRGTNSKTEHYLLSAQYRLSSRCASFEAGHPGRYPRRVPSVLYIWESLRALSYLF